jgi:CRISPR system Cascade subunit CasC
LRCWSLNPFPLRGSSEFKSEKEAAVAKIAEVHVVQNLPPSSLNRDEDGRPKSVWYGGVERLRISSQAQKRAMRLLFRDLSLVPPEERAVRTRKVGELLEEALGGLVPEERRRLVKGVLAALSLRLKNEEGLQTEYMLFLSSEEVRRLAGVALRHREAFLALGEGLEGDEGKEGRGKGKSKKEGQAKAKEVLSPEARRELAEALGTVSLELALFGRMMADQKDHDVEGALAVAHAVGTTADPIEEDYFVGVDDLAKPGEAQVAMIESRGYASGTVYRYAVLDLGELEALVGKERALLGLKAFLQTFPLALPRAGRRAFAHEGPPEVVLVRLGRGLPRNLARAFALPVEPRGEDPALASAKRLLAYWERLDRVYGPLEEEWKGGVSLFDGLPFPLAENFPRLAEEAAAWAAKL